MRKSISDEELNKIIRSAINEEIGREEEVSVPEGRDLSIVLKSLKTRARFVDFGKIGGDSVLGSTEFKKLLVNADKYNELFEKIKIMICGKVNNLKDIEFTLKTNTFQISNDDEKIFLIFEKEFKDFSEDEDGAKASFDANAALGDNIDLIGTEVNDKISRFGMSINLQYIQPNLIVTLNTPFDFAAYNNEIDKHMR
jgi:hypothetical protein